MKKSRDERALKLGIILLAAGSSSRMGQSKQLLTIEGEQLLRRIARIATSSNPVHLVVVLGANEQEHHRVIDDLPLAIAHHPGWKNGMGGSLKAGLQHLLKKDPDMEAVIVLVCDQPLLTTDHIEELKRSFLSSGAPVVASEYSGVMGVPALFDKSMFHELLTLRDDEGARAMIRRYSSLVRVVPFPNGAVDLDTKEDYENFRKSE